MLVVGRATYYSSLCSHTDRGAVPGFRRVFSFAVNLLKHRVINVCSESILNRYEIGFISVSGKFNFVGKSRFQIMHEVIGATGIALTDQPARNQFSFRVDCRPRPNIASAFCFHFRAAIFCLRSHKTPNLITLESLAFQIHESLVLILRASRRQSYNLQFLPLEFEIDQLRPAVSPAHRRDRKRGQVLKHLTFVRTVELKRELLFLFRFEFRGDADRRARNSSAVFLP